MPLLKLEDFDPNYRETFGDDDLKGLDVYAATNEKIGTISDVLVDEAGHFRYLVVETGFWVFGKKVLLPIGRAQHNHNARRVSVDLSKAQVEALPEFKGDMAIDYDHEEQVRGVYRTPATMTDATVAQPTRATSKRDSYTYQQEPDLYDLNDRDHQTIKLYQERLIANKTRTKTGEVAIGKHVETETARVSVPIEKERVVIERVTPADAGRAVAPGEVDFNSRQVTRMEIYEETPDIHKEAFVREEVRVNKVVEQETVQAQDTIRREELDIDTEGRTVEDRTGRLPKDRI